MGGRGERGKRGRGRREKEGELQILGSMVAKGLRVNRWLFA